MEKSKLIRSLKKLDQAEQERFGLLVASPYFNNNQDLARLLSLIYKEGILLENPKDSSYILEKLFPGKNYEIRRLTDLMYELTNLLEEFLTIEQMRQNTFDQKLKLMAFVYEKDMDAMVNGVEKDIELMHEHGTVRDSNYFYESFMVHAARDHSFRLHGKIADNESLQTKADHLDLFYLALKLKDACEMINRNRIVAGQYKIKLLDLIVPYLRANPDVYTAHPAVEVYLYMYLMLTDADHEKYFFGLKKLAGENEKTFTKDELRSIYGYVQNYCIRRLNQGNTDFLHHLFGIYKHMFQNQLVFGDNKNMEWDFKNYVSLGLRLKEYKWTLDMINVFKDHLPETVRHNAYTYNLANYYYEIADYKKATKLLNSVAFTEIFYNLDAKAMLLKIYYKVEEEESFYALVSSFNIYLQRNKRIAKDNAEIYANLIRFTKKAFLLKTKMPYERKTNFYKNVTHLKTAINETQKIANINWLRAEVEALGG